MLNATTLFLKDELIRCFEYSFMGKIIISVGGSMFPRIGMRNIKTSTAVFLCLLIFQLINRENSIQACIAAVICMQNTVVDSYKRGFQRVIGTIIGGITGGLVLFIVTNLGSEDLLIFIIPLGITLLIYICVNIDMKQSVVICCVVYLSILITKSHEGGYLLYTLNRVIDTIAGIMVALLVNKYMHIPDKFRKLSNNKKEYQDNESPEFTDENSSEVITTDIENNRED